MAWCLLVLAAALEVCWALALKASAGFTRPLPTLLFLIAAALSLLLLGLAARTLPIGLAYAVWTGLGAVGVVLAASALGEPPSPLQLGCIALIVTGVCGLKLAA